MEDETIVTTSLKNGMKSEKLREQILRLKKSLKDKDEKIYALKRLKATTGEEKEDYEEKCAVFGQPLHFGKSWHHP